LAAIDPKRLSITPSYTDAIPQQEYAIDIETCLDCGGKLDVIACMEEPLSIGKMLGHIQRRQKLTGSLARASPGCSKGATDPRHLPIGNFYAGAKVKYYSVTNISMSSRLCDR
jgi:hypothetical protein